MKHKFQFLLVLTLIALLVPKTPEQAPVQVDLQSPLSECAQSVSRMMPSTPVLPLPVGLSIRGVSPGMAVNEVETLLGKPLRPKIDREDQFEIWHEGGVVTHVNGPELTVDGRVLRPVDMNEL